MNYTKLRHQMLAAIRDGHVADGEDGLRWVFTCWPSTVSQMARACNAIWEDDCLEVTATGAVVLTDSGAVLLERWNQRTAGPRPTKETQT